MPISANATLVLVFLLLALCWKVSQASLAHVEQAQSAQWSRLEKALAAD